MNTCSPSVNESADGEQLAEVVLAGDTDPQAATDEHHVQAEDREQADEADLLAEAGDDEVAFGDRRDLRAALAEAGAEQAAVREAEDALHELVAAALGRDEVGSKAFSQASNRPCTYVRNCAATARRPRP